jgi:hypothetical protein
MQTKILISISICLSIAGICYADKIYFKDRNPIEGEIVQETDEVVVIEQSAGRYGSVTSSHSKKDIDRIEKVSLEENAKMKAIKEREAHENAIKVGGSRSSEISNTKNVPSRESNIKNVQSDSDIEKQEQLRQLRILLEQSEPGSVDGMFINEVIELREYTPDELSDVFVRQGWPRHAILRYISYFSLEQQYAIDKEIKRERHQ